ATRVAELSLLTGDERRQLLVTWNATARAYPDRCLHQLFDDQVRRTPDDVCVVSSGDPVTYRELSYRADQLARALRGQGIGREDVVAVSGERSDRVLAGVLGILKAGAAYLPLDPRMPRERLANILTAARARALLANAGLTENPPCPINVLRLDGNGWPANGDSTDPWVGPDSSACVIYTSGSTGEPKGVTLTHGAIVN